MYQFSMENWKSLRSSAGIINQYNFRYSKWAYKSRLNWGFLQNRVPLALSQQNGELLKHASTASEGLKKASCMNLPTAVAPFQATHKEQEEDFDMDRFGTLKQVTRRATIPALWTEEMLVSAAQAGQEWAFAELCSRCSKRILITLYKITKNREDAEDVLQESILKAFVHFKNFNRASAFSTWLTRISINSALMMLRKKRVRPEISIDASSDHGNEAFQWVIADRRANPEDLYLRHEINARLQAAISHLPRTYRDVVEIRQQSEGSLKAVAEHVGITLAATKSRMMRATKVLRNSLS